MRVLTKNKLKSTAQKKKKKNPNANILHLKLNSHSKNLHASMLQQISAISLRCLTYKQKAESSWTVAICMSDALNPFSPRESACLYVCMHHHG